MALKLSLLTLLLCLAAVVLGANHNQANHPTDATIQATNRTGGTNQLRYKHFACGTNSSFATEHYLNTVRALHGKHGPKGAPGARKRSELPKRDFAVTVNTYIHVVTSSALVGNITQDMVNAQLSALNEAYQSAGFQFNLKAATYTVNDKWAVGAGQDDVDMKTALRNGTYQDLNLYLQTNLDGDDLGVCTLPIDIAGLTNYLPDGCNVYAFTMPNSTDVGFNQGKTAVHEAGHWLGLLHTFEGDTCDGDGDYVDDTPMQSVSTDGCPTSPVKDSCPNSPGVDPIHNYMDYSDDECYTSFSDGQIARMQDLWGVYRSGN